MKSPIQAFVMGSILACAASAQQAPPALRKGVSVQMAVADHAVEMRAADSEQAIVVAITADGRLYNGAEPTDAGALGKLSAGTVYVKADSRVPFQKVLTVLDALRGKTVVMLAAPPKKAEGGGMVAPYGMELTVSR